MLYSFARFVTYLYARLRFRMRYEGLENIPPGGGYILCSNHRSNHDAVFLCHKIRKHLRFMAKEELFKNKLLGAVFRKVGAFPIARGKGDTGAIDISTKIIRDGGVLLIFPEGTRSKDGRPQRARTGVAVLSARTGAGVLCVSIDYGEKLRFRTPVVMRFHPLLTNAELGARADAPSTLRKAAKQVMETIAGGLSLLPPAEEEVA